MEQATARPLDVITIGRSSVDLYGQQIGTRLEDVGSFAKSVGGCPTNIAVGTARLGLRSALITRVGDEQMGRFIREQLTREGVDTTRHRHRPRPAYRAGAARRRGRGRLADDLLPHRLRRHGALRGRYRRRLHRLGPRHRRHRHAFFATRPRRRAAQGHPPRPRAWRAKSCSTSTIAPISGALPATPPASRATSNPPRSPQRTRRFSRHRPRRRHRGGNSHRRRAPTISPPRSPPSAPDRRHYRPQARRHGLHRLCRRDPAEPRRRRHRPRLSDRDLQCARRRRRLHVGVFARLAGRRNSRQLRQLGQCLRRLRRLAPALRAGISEF